MKKIILSVLSIFCTIQGVPQSSVPVPFPLGSVILEHRQTLVTQGVATFSSANSFFTNELVLAPIPDPSGESTQHFWQVGKIIDLIDDWYHVSFEDHNVIELLLPAGSIGKIIAGSLS